MVRLKDLILDQDTAKRVPTGSGEFDRVLGGGMVPGSVILVAGEPGIGKSTLLTQLALKVGVHHGGPVLYVCGEESPNQVGLRIKRLSNIQNQNILMLATTDVDDVVEAAQGEKPDLMIVDSIQTMTTGDLVGMAGSVGQVRECTNRLISYAKTQEVPIFLVGHVTKEGSVAGPKVLEHMVDCVLSLEGEKTGLWRILRAYKNRFGPADEVGVFTMDESGLTDVPNPSGAFLEESQAGQPGSATAVVMEGTRPVLLEVQALTVPTTLPIPRRIAQGFPLAKIQLMVAILTKHCRLPLSDKDVFVNVAGGLKVTEPAADLALALAIASSAVGKALPKGSVAIGEVGLLGEIRRVNFLSRRVKEAKALGFKQTITPETQPYVRQVVRSLLA